MLSQRAPRRLALALAAALALATAATASADVSFPAPGAMQVAGLPAQLPAGHTFTLREVLPLAVWHGRVRFQLELPSGAWRTVATAAIRPRVFWLHWFVPKALAGTQLSVRFVLQSRDQLLALSDPATISVGG
jgi:hypothetical protein